MGKICILAFNRPEWIVSDVGTMMAGGVPAGFYQTCSPEEVTYIVSHSEAEIVVVEDKVQWKKVHQNLGELPNLKYIVTMEGQDPSTWEDVTKTLSWKEFLDLGTDIPETKFKRIGCTHPQSSGYFYLYIRNNRSSQGRHAQS